MNAQEKARLLSDLNAKRSAYALALFRYALTLDEVERMLQADAEEIELTSLFLSFEKEGT